MRSVGFSVFPPPARPSAVRRSAAPRVAFGETADTPPVGRARTWVMEVQDLLEALAGMPELTEEQDHWYQVLSPALDLYRSAGERKRGFSIKVATHYAPVMARIYDDLSRDRTGSRWAFWRPTHQVVNEAYQQRALFWATIARCTRNTMPTRLFLKKAYIPGKKKREIRQKVLQFFQVNQILPVFTMTEHFDLKKVREHSFSPLVADAHRWPAEHRPSGPEYLPEILSEPVPEVIPDATPGMLPEFFPESFVESNVPEE